VLEEIAANPRVAKYVDVPLQHVTDGMLRAMRRGINAARQRRLLEEIRRTIPGVAIRSTMISGFPGETEEDHRALLKTVREGWFDRLGVFPFSREDGTPSHDLPDQVPAEVAERRRGEVMEAQAEVHRRRNLEKVGRTLDVLVETVDPLRRTALGRTEHDAPDVDGRVVLRDVRGVKPGAMLAVRITAADGYDLVGEAHSAVPAR
jgi:ribosomal protein S12 methylthiotransferase